MNLPVDTPKTYLTLSAAPESQHTSPEVPTSPPATIAALREERDPLTRELVDELAPITESELRALWGDR